MRAREFIVEDNESRTEEFQGVHMKLRDDGYEVVASALDDWGREMGAVVFNKGDGNELDPQDLLVIDKFRGQGIAKVMYDYVKSKGYEIHKSYDVTKIADQGKESGEYFWQKNRGEERIWEAFDKPYKGKWEKSEYSGSVDVLTKLPDGTNLSIMFNDEGDGEYQVEFYRNNSLAVTGEGDAQRVFATVLAAIQKFIKKYKPWRLTFSASKDPDEAHNTESRAKLYNRMVQRYARAWGYEDYAEDHGDQITYELTQLKQGVAEDELEEDWKSKLATGAMAGAMAMSGAHAKGPEWTERPDGSIVKSIKQARDAVKKVLPSFNTQPDVPKAEPGMSLLSRNNAEAEAVLHTSALKAGLRGAELAQFLAQTRHESADFAHMKEIGNKQRFAKYEAPHKAKQLGNKYKGDGERFKGRGFIQLTGRDNYTRASEQIFGDNRLVKTPDLASRLDVASNIALWYWQNHVRPNVSNFNDTRAVTKAINPALRGLQDRHNNFKEYMAIL